MKSHWTEDAERVTSGDPRILGEDENGDLYLPSRTREGYWDRRFRPGRPTHWPYWLRSRLTSRLAWLESER